MRTGAFDVPPQEILTRDSVTVSVDAVVYYQAGLLYISMMHVDHTYHTTYLAYSVMFLTNILSHIQQQTNSHQKLNK